MSTSLGRALRTVLTLACALAALAAVAGTAAASGTLPAVESPVRLILLGAEYNARTNTYTVNARGSLSVPLNVGGEGIDPFLADNAFPADQRRFFCSSPEYAGIYATFGLLTPTWEPSQGGPAENRVGGLSIWANTSGRATVVAGGGCALVPGQAPLSREGRFLTSTTLTFCQERGGGFVMTGTATGSGGRPVTYLIPSSTNTWHLYSIGAFGTIDEELEQVVNVHVDGLPNPSTACGSI